MGEDILDSSKPWLWIIIIGVIILLLVLLALYYKCRKSENEKQTAIQSRTLQMAQTHNIQITNSPTSDKVTTNTTMGEHQEETIGLTETLNQGTTTEKDGEHHTTQTMELAEEIQHMVDIRDLENEQLL